MAWNESFRINGGSKTGWTYKLSIYEDTVDVPFIKQFDCVGSFNLKFLNREDDVFDPIVASNLEFTIIDDGTTELPDFINANDRKYYCVLTATKDAATWTLWRGWLLNDGVSVKFSTGVRLLNITCVDGLAMLNDIDYIPGDEDINALDSLKNVLLNCLDQVNFPDDFKVNVCVSTFANGMSKRSDATANEPLSQSYTYNYTWYDDKGQPLSCYEVLRRIMISFNCKLFQSIGDWQMVQVNEMASSSLYLTQYNAAGAVVTSANANIRGVIKPYPNALHFINNDQMKYLRKGFDKIKVSQSANFGFSAIDNADISRLTSGFPTNFTPQTTGSGSGVSFQQSDSRWCFIRVNSAPDPTNTLGWAGIRSDSVGRISQGAKMRFSCDFIGPSQTSTGTTLFLEIILTRNGSSVFRWLKAGTDGPFWSDTSGLYEITEGWQGRPVNISVDIPPVPFDAEVSFRIANGYTALGTALVFVSNIEFKYTPAKDTLILELEKNDTDGKYVYDAQNYLGWDQLDPESTYSTTPLNAATTSSGTSHSFRLNPGDGSFFLNPDTNLRYVGADASLKITLNFLFRWNSAASATLHILKNGVSIGSAFVGSGGPTGFKNITLTVDDVQFSTNDIVIVQLQWTGSQAYTIDTISGTFSVLDYGFSFFGLSGSLMNGLGIEWSNWGRKDADGTLRFIETNALNYFDVLSYSQVSVEGNMADVFAPKNGEAVDYAINPTVSFICQDGQPIININTKPCIFVNGDFTYGPDSFSGRLLQTSATELSNYTETYTKE